MTTAASDLKEKKTDRATYCLGPVYFEAREFEYRSLYVLKNYFQKASMCNNLSRDISFFTCTVYSLAVPIYFGS